MNETEIPTLTVAALRALLDGVPGDYLVDADGCDCVGRAGSIEVDAEERRVLVLRCETIDRDARMAAYAARGDSDRE